VNLFADLSITFSMVLNYNMTQKHDLEQIIQESFKKLKNDFYQTYKIEKREEDTWPPTLELRDIIESLPPNLQIIELLGPQDH
jgi:predicted aldo/keto reductase-like oxidoreductase